VSGSQKSFDFFRLKWRAMVYPVRHFCSDIETAEYQLYCGFRCKFTFSWMSSFLEIERKVAVTTVNKATKLTVATSLLLENISNK